VTQRGGIITGLLFRAVLIFAVLGISVYEAGAIIVTKVAADDVAQKAAREAAIGYSGSAGSSTKAKRECVRMAERSGATCEDVRVSRGSVTVRVSKRAPTLIVHRFGPFRAHTIATAEGRSTIP
jgi:hypothetical protein